MVSKLCETIFSSQQMILQFFRGAKSRVILKKILIFEKCLVRAPKRRWICHLLYALNGETDMFPVPNGIFLRTRLKRKGDKLSPCRSPEITIKTSITLASCYDPRASFIQTWSASLRYQTRAKFFQRLFRRVNIWLMVLRLLRKPNW